MVLGFKACFLVFLRLLGLFQPPWLWCTQSHTFWGFCAARLGQTHKAGWNEGKDNSPGVMYKNFHRSNSPFDYFFSIASERNSMLELSMWLNCYWKYVKPQKITRVRDIGTLCLVSKLFVTASLSLCCMGSVCVYGRFKISLCGKGRAAC